MKICICTTPIRPEPTTFPPFGSMAIIQSLRKIGENAIFFNIDYFRYDKKFIESYFKENQFDVVGVSAVVSTAYRYTKWLIQVIKKNSPNTIVVVGGNLAASAELVLRKCKADICVIGDGEIIFNELISLLRKCNTPYRNSLETVKGIAYLDQADKFKFTGFGMKLEANEIEFPDYSILISDKSINHFIYPNKDILGGQVYGSGPGYPHMKEGNTATVISTKGCVARCTFCHRWERGYRVRPYESLIEHIKTLIDRHGVSHITFGDENFGADRNETRKFVAELGALGITWTVSGVRARTVLSDDLILWRKNGCLAAYFGIESGSVKMLSIMEKNITLEENINAMKWVSDAKISTVIQLIIGMPGEDEATIAETIEFLKLVSDFSIDWESNLPSDLISINYAQALPGTPLYEWARESGFIGSTMGDEEKYLLKISDTDAYEADHFVNYTNQSLLSVLSWRTYILSEVDAHHIKQKNGYVSLSLGGILKNYFNWITSRLLKKFGRNKSEHSSNNSALESGYFNIHGGLKFYPLLLNENTKIFYKFGVILFVGVKESSNLFHFMKLIFQHMFFSILPQKITKPVEKKSLRKIIKINSSSEVDETLNNMIPLRQGR
jgi:anaerobic magnesium-protoporphyrin IX monomethyl ester cyclase